MAAVPARLRHDTSAEQPHRQFSFWNEAVCGVMTPLVCSRPLPSAVPFRGELDTVVTSGICVSRARSEALRAQRRRGDIGKSAEDWLFAVVFLRGRAQCDQAGAQLELAPGDLVLLDTGRPYDLRFDGSSDILVMQVPQRLLRDYFREPRTLAGTRMSYRQGMAALLVSYLWNLWSLADEGICTTGSAHVGRVGLELLEAAVTQAVRAQQPADRHGARVRSIRRMIERDLSMPGLSPRSIAGALGFSTRYLHRLFAREGIPVARYIQTRRLEECARDLKDPRARDCTVTDIAMRWGFADASHFGRVFKRTYGVTPQQFRGNGVRG